MPRRASLLCLWLLGCREARHPEPSCSDAAYTELTADCAAEAAACVVGGGSETVCGAICDDRADQWRERCQ
jgi:hypothetical protein